MHLWFFLWMYLFVYLLQYLLLWVAYFFAFLSSDDLITIWHKVRNCIFVLLHPWFGFHGSASPLWSSMSVGYCEKKEKRGIVRESQVGHKGSFKLAIKFITLTDQVSKALSSSVAALAAQSAHYSRCSAKSICSHTHGLEMCWVKTKKNTHLMLVW